MAIFMSLFSDSVSSKQRNQVQNRLGEINMSIVIRGYEETDLTQIQEINFILWLELQWHKEFEKENAFVALKGEQIVGVGALSYDASWHCMDLETEHKLHMDVTLRAESQNPDEIKRGLIQTLLSKFRAYQESYPDKNLSISYWQESTQIEDMQRFLKEGFHMKGVTPVLKYDLTKEIKHVAIPSCIQIEALPIDEANVDAFIKATALANEGVPDSKAELWFRSGSETLKIFVAKDQDQIVSAVTLWDIGEGRAATENIFTIPAYRRQNIAREVIAAGLEDLKRRGNQIATLSMVGSNANAMKLYESIGYELMYLLIELRYQ
jgi:ribosomal protein S18 acetylase RimI-like enzyme